MENEKITAAAPRALAETIIKILDGKKAHDIKLLHVTEQTIIADYFIICSGTSNTQIKALADEVEHKLREDHSLEPKSVEGFREASWILLDYASVIVHIFNPHEREFYNLEKLWNDGEEIDISSLINP